MEFAENIICISNFYKLKTNEPAQIRQARVEILSSHTARTFKSSYASIAICKASSVAPVAAIARSPCPTRAKMLDSLLMCLLRLTVRVIMRERRRRLNYLRGKASGSDDVSSLLNGLPPR